MGNVDFVFSSFLIILGLQGVLVNSESIRRSVCLLEDAPSQCGAFCLAALQPLIDDNYQISTRLDGIEGRLNRTEEQLQLLQAKMEDLHLVLKDGMQLLSKMAAQKVHPRFKKIGTRFFYIEYHKMVTWPVAAGICRRMGGYLAAIKNGEELEVISAELKTDTSYWLGIKAQTKKGNWVSLASGKPATPFKLVSQPGEEDHTRYCIDLYEDTFFENDCTELYYFICQADNVV
ncbi:accessory gland protein Acp29AB-like [Drosophila elegans]|uniref:accessory gland protein Acp29AB-like n=1 Tax=Drosophila elegans TaxID=30023 RepID=UPI001BC8329E|nr:accessory gland protein Acp29AB-like [Drosophila elegans]